MDKITVLDKEIELYTQNKEDYICLTDIAKYKSPNRGDYVIQNSRHCLENLAGVIKRCTSVKKIYSSQRGRNRFLLIINV